MSEIDRLVESLVASRAPVNRSSLEEEGARLLPVVAPLAGESAVAKAIDSIVGLGPLEPLIEDTYVSDILVNAPDDVWVERAGVLVKTGISFRSDDDVLAMVRRVIAPLGLRIDRAEPAVDARLPDGSRLHAAIPPASVDGTVVAIRRFQVTVRSIDDLRASGTVSDEHADALRESVARRDNIVVAGPTGSGKTTLLNVLCSLIEPDQRIVTIEDAAELRIPGHVVRLESRRANADGAGNVTMRDLVRHALRLRPDRIVIGEVRGPEALDMVHALATGHRGSMSTVHARTVEQALSRIETLAAMAPEAVPHAALSALVASAIDSVVLIERTSDGRKVTAVSAVGGDAP